LFNNINRATFHFVGTSHLVNSIRHGEQFWALNLKISLTIDPGTPSIPTALFTFSRPTASLSSTIWTTSPTAGVPTPLSSVTSSIGTSIFSVKKIFPMMFSAYSLPRLTFGLLFLSVFYRASPTDHDRKYQ
jgi:hypothetical protein